MKGFITGLMFAVLALIVGLVFWLYGSKIKQDINDKINSDQEQTTATKTTQGDSNLVVLNLTYKI